MHSLKDLMAVAGDESALQRLLDENQREAEHQLGIVHKVGVPWHTAPMPRRWHRCRAWSTGLGWKFCACGGKTLEGHEVRGRDVWIERNSRRLS